MIDWDSLTATSGVSSHLRDSSGGWPSPLWPYLGHASLFPHFSSVSPAIFQVSSMDYRGRHLCIQWGNLSSFFPDLFLQLADGSRLSRINSVFKIDPQVEVRGLSLGYRRPTQNPSWGWWLVFQSVLWGSLLICLVCIRNGKLLRS